MCYQSDLPFWRFLYCMKGIWRTNVLSMIRAQKFIYFHYWK